MAIIPDKTEQRINRLEKKIKIQQLLLVGLVMLFGLLAAKPNYFDEVIPILKTRNLQIVNKEGKVVAVLQTRETAGGFSIYTNEGKEIIYGGSNGSGGLMQISNAADKSIIQLSTRKSGASLKFYDNEKKSVVYLGEDKRNRGAGSLFLSKNGVPKIMMNAVDQKMFIADSTQKSGFQSFPFDD